MLKKVLISIFSIIICINTVYSQSAFSDAVELSTNMLDKQGKFKSTLENKDAKTKVPVYLKILRKYIKSELVNLTDLELKRYLYKENPILRDFLKDTEGLEDDKTITEAIEKLRLPQIKGFSVTNLADGVAKFLVERAKEELNVAFFVKFQKELTKEKYKDLRILFPSTHRLLLAIGTEIYNYGYYIQGLKNSFEKDLSTIYSSIPLLLKEEPYSKFLNDHLYLKTIFKSSFYLIENILEDKHPGDILNNFKTEDMDNPNLPNNVLMNLSSSIKLLKLISNSLRDHENENQYWLNKNSINNLLEKNGKNEFIILKIYLGLIYQQAFNMKDTKDDIVFFIREKKICFTSSLEKLFQNKQTVETEVHSYFSFIERFISRVEILDSYRIEFKKKMTETNEKLKYEDYYKYYNASIGLFEFFLGMKDLSGIGFEVNHTFEKFLIISRTLGDIYLDAKQKNYYSIPLKIANIYDHLFIKTKNGLQELDNMAKIRSMIIKYGYFISAVAMAENSDQIKDAIESVVLPAGSSSMKENSSLTITLNSYVGVFLGNEHLEKGTKQKWFNTVGVIAPIGLEISTGLPFLVFKSISIFGSVLDLGTITAFRFKDNTTEKLPELTFKNIIAPGVYGIFGLKGVPISIGGGVQYGPQLRTIKITDEGNEITSSAWRFNLFIAVDIPLLKFYNISK